MDWKGRIIGIYAQLMHRDLEWWEFWRRHQTNIVYGRVRVEDM